MIAKSVVMGFWALVADVADAGKNVRYLRLVTRKAPPLNPGKSWAVQFNNIRIVSHVR